MDSDISLHLTIIKIDLCRLLVTRLLLKLGLAIRHIGTLVHIAALPSDLSFSMQQCAINLLCVTMAQRALAIECSIHGLQQLIQRAVALDV